MEKKTRKKRDNLVKSTIGLLSIVTTIKATDAQNFGLRGGETLTIHVHPKSLASRILHVNV